MHRAFGGCYTPSTGILVRKATGRPEHFNVGAVFGCNGQFRDYGSGCTLFTVKQNPVHVAGISDGNDGASIARDVFLLHLLHGKPLRAKIIRCGLGQASGNSRQMLGGCDLLVGAISAVLRIFQQMDHAIGNAVIGFPQGGQVHILLHHAGHAHRLVLLVPPSKKSISCPRKVYPVLTGVGALTVSPLITPIGDSSRPPAVSNVIHLASCTTG